MKNSNYVAPEIEVLEVNVENGFAASPATLEEEILLINEWQYVEFNATQLMKLWFGDFSTENVTDFDGDMSRLSFSASPMRFSGVKAAKISLCASIGRSP